MTPVTAPAAPAIIQSSARRNDGVDRALDAWLDGSSLEEVARDLGLRPATTSRFLARRLAARG